MLGIVLSLDFDADGNLELWPPDPAFTGAAGDPAGALDLDLGWFHINDSLSLPRREGDRLSPP